MPYSPIQEPISNRPWWRTRIAIGIIVLIFLLLLAALLVQGLRGIVQNGSSNNANSSPTPAATATPTPLTTSTPTPTASPASSSVVKVYFSRHPESDNDFEKVYAVERTAPDAGVAKAAFAALLAGPSAAEKASNLFTSWTLNGASTCGPDGFTISIADSKATVRLCRDYSSAGTGQDARAKAEADATLTQFASISKAVYLNKNGDCLFDASGQNACLK